MDTIRVYMRLQAIGKLCINAAWIVLVLGLLLCGYVIYNLSNAAATSIDSTTYVPVFVMALIAIALPVGTFTILLFASGTLIAYITMQDDPSLDDELAEEPVVNNQDKSYSLEISSISKDESDQLS